MKTTEEAQLRQVLFGIVLLAMILSGIRPYDWPTWFMEAAPVLIGLPLLIVTARKFPLTPLVTGLIALHMVILLIGAHYTYERMPLFNWIRDQFGLARNHYDRVGHFMQGFVPAMVARELLLRTSPLKPGKWLFAVVGLCCLGISALYELSEWAAALLLGDAADSFLGVQGDVWDTQWDLFLAGVGAVIALLTLGRRHDRALADL